MKKFIYWGIPLIITIIVAAIGYNEIVKYQLHIQKPTTFYKDVEYKPDTKPVNNDKTENKKIITNETNEPIKDLYAGLSYQERMDKIYPKLDLISLNWDNLTDHQILTLLNQREQWNSITQEQRDNVVREFYKRALGMMPPPDGYYYRSNPDGSVILGEDGLPIAYKLGEPVFQIKTRIGFRPTRDQILTHKALVDIYAVYTNKNDHETAGLIQAEINKLESEAVGEIPLIMAGTQSKGSLDKASWHSKLDERAREEYRKMGIEHVYLYTHKGVIQ